MKRRESGSSSPVISHHQQHHHQPAQITSQFDMQRMHQQQQQQHHQHHRMAERYLPYNYSPSTEHHPLRPGSPPRGADLRDIMYPHLVKAGMERSPHAVAAALMSPHPAHPFSSARTPEPPSHEFHRGGRGPPHNIHPSHLAAAADAAYLRERVHANRSSGLDTTTPTGDRLLSERPGVDPAVSTSGGPLQPQLHAHHHTHTHLHLHDELKYRNGANGGTPTDPSSAGPAAAHLDRHGEPPHGGVHPVMPPTPPIPSTSHRPSSRSSSVAPTPRDLYEYQHHKSFPSSESLNQARLREMSRHHMPPPPHSRDSHPPLTPGGVRGEGAASPSFMPPHDHQEMMADPVAYHHYIKQQQQISRKYPHAAPSRHGHGQAPDLSPRGLPPRPNPAAEFSRETMEKHFAEKMPAASPHMDLREQHARAAMEEKIRHRMLLAERAPPDVLKASSELLMDRDRERSAAAYREELHAGYSSSYDAALRRMHAEQQQQHQPRSMYDQRALPEHLMMSAHSRERIMERDHHRDRLERDRLDHERMVRERSSVVFGGGERAAVLNERERVLAERYMRQREQEKQLPHARSPMIDQHHLVEQQRGPLPHERPAYFYKQPPTETIDLSEE